VGEDEVARDEVMRSGSVEAWRRQGPRGTDRADGCDVGAGPSVDARGTCPAGEGVGRVTDISTLARLTVGVSGEHSEAVRVHCTPG
jgi:hypothetical protein